MENVMAEYQGLGMEPEFEVPCTVTFCDRITMGDRVLESTLGQYNRVTHSIRMVGLGSEIFRNSDHLGIDDWEIAYRVILQHEITHYMNSLLVPQMHPVVDEYVAGYMQFVEVDQQIIDAAVVRWAGGTPIPLSQVSIMRYVAAPKEFLMFGYRYFQRHPASLLRCLRSGGPRIRDPFMIGA
jgi:hypothetical protein